MSEGSFLDKVKAAVTGGGGGGPSLDDTMAKAEELGLDPDKLKELLANFTDADGNIDWAGAVEKAQDMGLDPDKIKQLIT